MMTRSFCLLFVLYAYAHPGTCNPITSILIVSSSGSQTAPLAHAALDVLLALPSPHRRVILLADDDDAPYTTQRVERRSPTVSGFLSVLAEVTALIHSQPVTRLRTGGLELRKRQLHRDTAAHKSRRAGRVGLRWTPHPVGHGLGNP